ncbi:hypothetical protein [Paludifilum halophilum]|uniref:hypothetical protein n=1 Tax=Paludifilum halophilum TaxID=1642702 RepID=UPI00269F0450
MMEAVNRYLIEKRTEHLEELKQFIRIPSVSTKSEFRRDMFRCARHVAGLLQKAGLEHVQWLRTEGHPIV